MSETSETFDEAVILAAAALHDTIDEKVIVNKEKQLQAVHELLSKEMTPEQIKKVEFIIQHMSYAQNIEQQIQLPIEGQIVQDADRLDAIGSIGIARAFYYGGHRGDRLYDESIVPRDQLTYQTYRSMDGTVINHFYEKTVAPERDDEHKCWTANSRAKTSTDADIYSRFQIRMARRKLVPFNLVNRLTNIS